MVKIRIAYFVSVEQELFELHCFFKNYLNNPKYSNHLFYEESNRVESQLNSNKYFFDNTSMLKRIGFSKRLFTTTKNYITNKAILENYKNQIDYLVSFDNNTLTFCQLYGSLNKFNFIVFKTIHPSFFYKDYLSSIYYNFFSLLFCKRIMVYRKHLKKGKIFNYPFPLIKADFILTTNEKVYNEEKKKTGQSFLVKHPFKNIFRNNSNSYLPLIIIDSLYTEVDKNYLIDVKNRFIQQKIKDPIIYIKDHPLAKIDSSELKKVFNENFEIIDNKINGLNLLMSFKFSPIISGGPSTLIYYAKLFGIEIIDISKDLKISNEEVKSKVTEMEESINNEGLNSKKILDNIIS